MMEIIITSSVLIACILLLRLVFHKKLSRRLQYALWLIVALRLLIPVSFSAPISVMNAFESLGGRQAVSAEQIDGETQAKPQQPDNIVTEPIIDAGGQAVVDDMHEPVPTVPSPAVQPKIAPEDVAKAVWLIGAGAVGLWLLCVNIIFQIKLKKDRKPYSCGCSKLPVYVTTKVQTPCMFGLFKPAIYITPQVTQNKQTMNHVITHELCHYAQLDHIWSVVRILCIALYWFNPLVWAAAVCSRSDCELSCDELAVKRLGEGNRLNYGKTLVELVQSRPSFSSLTCTATTMVAKKSQIKKRINMIVKSPKTIVWALVVLVLVLGVVVACTFTGAEKDKADDSKVLSVKTLDTLGLTATLPDGLKLNDINYDKYNQTSVAWDAYEDVTVDNFIIAMNILDQKSEELYKDIPVLHINAFEWSEGAPEDYTYRLVGENAGDKTYEEIKPYIIYQDDSRLVVEISAFTGENYKADMEKYIEENEGKGRFEGSSAPIANEPFANGRDVYDYGWVPSAFNVITANKNKLIVPEPPEQGLTRTVTFEFPARKITNPNGLPIIDEINATEKFYLKVTLPNSWTAQGYKEVYEETVPMGDFYTPEYIYDLSGKNDYELLGYIGFNTFEPYEGEIAPEEYYKTVYSGLRLSSMCFWDPYTPVKTTANGETGVAMIQYKDPEAIKASPEKSMAEIPNLETWGILSYDKALGVYIGIAFNPGTVDMEEAKKIAETIELTSVKITNGKDSRLLIGKSLDDLGLKATLPAGVKVSDPNYTKQIADGDYFNNVNGSGHWVMFDFLTAPVNGQDSMKVLNVCAFKLDAGESPLSYSYKISNLPDVDNIKTYKEIKPYIIYQDRYRIVVETSAFLGEDLRSETEKFIEQNRMTEPKRNADGEIVPSVPYADGTYLYKYDWLLDVYDTIEKNKKNLIVPEKQNTVPTEISDTFTYLWRSANEVYNVDSAELFEFGETVKLYDNSPEYTEIKNYDEVVNKIFTANGKNQLESTYLGGDKYTFIQKSGGKVYRLAPWKTGTSYVNSLYQVSYVDDISNGRATFEVKYKKPTANENAEPEIGTVEFILVNQNGTWLVDNYVYPEAVKKINSENAQGNVLAPLKTKAEEALISAVEKQYLENNEKVIVVDASISPNGKLKAYAVQYGNKPEAEGLFATDPEPTAEVVVEYNGKKRTIFKDNYSHSLQAFPCKLFWADNDTLVYNGSKIYNVTAEKTTSFNNGAVYKIISADVKNNFYAQIIDDDNNPSLQIVDVANGKQTASYPLTMFKNDWFNCSQGALKIGFSNDGTEVIIAYADMVTAPDYLLVKTARYNIAENKLSTWNTVLETTVKTEDAVIDSVKNETVYATMYQNGDRITLSLPS